MRWLREEDTRIPLLGLDPKKPNTARLPQVYVPALTHARHKEEWLDGEGRDYELLSERLDTQSLYIPGAPGAGKEEWLDREGRDYDLLLERLDTHSLYIPGAPGAGKSVFCRWVAWVVASGRMGERPGEGPEEYRERLPRKLLGRLPLLVRLREFHGYVDCGKDAGSWSRTQLEDALTAWLEQKRPGGLGSESFHRNLGAGNCLLLLDGMDEVPVSREGNGLSVYPRQALISGLADALSDWQAKGNRVLLTSRPYGLEPAQTRALGLPEAAMAPLPEKLQELFVARWFAAVDPREAQRNTRGLLEQLGERPQLAELTGSPVLLNALCVKYDDGHRLPRDIYDLYSSIVDRVLHSRYLDRTIEVEAVRRRLGAVALGMHTGEAVRQQRSVPLAEIGHDELDAILAAYAERDPSKAAGADGAAAGRDELLARSGLLQATGQRRASFYHLTFQEFLAAERIARSRLNDQAGMQRLIVERSGKPEWRRTLQFLFAALWERAEPATALECFAPLLDYLDVEQLAANPNPAFLLGDCLEIVHAKQSQAPEIDQAYRKACMDSLEAELPPPTRAGLFDALGKAGLDERFGIGLDADGLPAFDWVEIPGGKVELEDKRGTYQVEPFHIARYLVTQAQYQVFIEADDGYKNPHWWEEEWLLQGWVDPAKPPKPRWRGPNRPMEQVSWHQALGFCRWLTARLGFEVQLPTEMQWQQAATGGVQKNRYPWGDEYRTGHANIHDIQGEGYYHLGQTSAVGIYPKGRSLQGVLDMSGNLWELCLNRYAEPNDVSPASRELRSLRGSCWYYLDGLARAGFRNSGRPNYRGNDVGFRVCCLSPIDDH